MTFTKHVPIALAALMLTASGAYANQNWDADKDGRIGTVEYQQAYQGSGVFDNFDTDSDGQLSSAEFGQALFNRYDLDNNGYLDREEQRLADEEGWFQ